MENLIAGIEMLARLDVLLALLVGSIGGVIIGAIPGVGPAVAIAILLPATFSLEPIVGLTVLLGIYGSSMYGGAIPAVLINTPGTAVNALTSYDGYPMTEKGEAHRAVSLAYSASFWGGIFGILCLILLSPVLALIAPMFGSREIFLAALLGILLVILAHRGQIFAAGLLAMLGIFLQTVGLDAVTYSQRYTFGFSFLSSGINLIVVVLGLFALSQAFFLLIAPDSSPNAKPVTGRLSAGLKELLGHKRVATVASGFGVILGMIPGTGEFTAQFMSYTYAQKTSRAPEKFGQGSPEGLIASEAANNAVPAAAMIPLLALGIPGEALTAMMLSVFYVHNVIPGPQLIPERYRPGLCAVFCTDCTQCHCDGFPAFLNQSIDQGHSNSNTIPGCHDFDSVICGCLFTSQFTDRLHDRCGIRCVGSGAQASQPADCADHPGHGARWHHGGQIALIPAEAQNADGHD